MNSLSISSSPAGLLGKERESPSKEPISLGGERYPLIEEKEMEISKELEPFVQKIEKEIYLAKPVNDDQGQPVVTAPSAQSAQIVLPLSQKQLLYGLKQSVDDSIRWLAEWCLRLVKIFGQKITFRKEDHVVDRTN